MMDWKDVAFCSDKPIEGLNVDVESIVKTLSGDKRIFPAGLSSVFSDRYVRMRENFLESCVTHPEKWKQGDLCLSNTQEYKDALLEIPSTYSAFSNNHEWLDILQNPCVGHDLPVWMWGSKPNINRRVMIVSQDPLRTGHGNKKLLLSTPFGYHSAEYRNNNRLMILLTLRLMEEGVILYFTDVMKIYNRKPEPLKLDPKTKRYKSPCKGCSHYNECISQRQQISKKKLSIRRGYMELYKECLNEEIKLFSPNVILVLGADTANSMKIDVANFKGRACPDPYNYSYDVDGASYNCKVAIHPSYITAYREKIGIKLRSPIASYLPYYLNNLLSSLSN